jgi:hypothetical protein
MLCVSTIKGSFFLCFIQNSIMSCGIPFWRQSTTTSGELNTDYLHSPCRRLRSPRRHELETLPVSQVDSRRAAQRPNLRTAAKTRSWEQAEKYARKLEAENDPLQPEKDRSFGRSTIRNAVQLVLDDQAARGLNPAHRRSTARFYKTSFSSGWKSTRS